MKSLSGTCGAATAPSPVDPAVAGEADAKRILDEALDLLDRARDECMEDVLAGNWSRSDCLSRRRIAELANVNVWWLNKFAARTIPEPSILKVLKVRAVLIEHYAKVDARGVGGAPA